MPRRRVVGAAGSRCLSAPVASQLSSEEGELIDEGLEGLSGDEGLEGLSALGGGVELPSSELAGSELCVTGPSGDTMLLDPGGPSGALSSELPLEVDTALVGDVALSVDAGEGTGTGVNWSAEGNAAC